MKRTIAILLTGLFLVAGVSITATAAETVPIRLGGFWVMSGIFRSFGVNSKAVYESFVEEQNEKGGIKLKDGRIGVIETEFYDSACNAEQAIALVRKMASQDKLLLAVGPSCSSALEPVFGILQKRLDDPNDTGLQFMVFSDTSAKPGLGKLTPWGFRASPDESAMYLDVMKHIKALGLKTVAFGYEDDFAHSTATYRVMRKHALASGLEVVSDQGWHNADTEFSTQTRKIRVAPPAVADPAPQEGEDELKRGIDRHQKCHQIGRRVEMLGPERQERDDDAEADHVDEYRQQQNGKRAAGLGRLGQFGLRRSR